MENDPSEFLPEPELMVEPTVGQLGLCGDDAGSMIVVRSEWLEDDVLPQFSWLDPSRHRT